MSEPGEPRNLHVFVCTTVGRHHCGGLGSERILQRLRDEVERRDLHWVRTTRMGCNQQHHQGPVVIVYPDGVWYGRLAVDGGQLAGLLFFCAGALTAEA